MGFPVATYLRADLPPRLRASVASVVAYDVQLGAAGTHVGLPSTTLTLQMTSGRPLGVGWASTPAESSTSWSVVAGLHTRPVRVVHEGRMTGVEVAFTTAGAKAILGVHAADLAENIVGLDDLNRRFDPLIEGVALATTPHERIERAVSGLLAVADRPEVARPMRAETGYALARLTRGARVDEVATATGLSRRHLANLVKAECGLSPKSYQRVARLEYSYTTLERAARRARPSLAAVAAQAGYADQAHMTHDWAQMAGITPAEWLRTEFPFLQDTPVA